MEIVYNITEIIIETLRLAIKKLSGIKKGLPQVHQECLHCFMESLRSDHESLKVFNQLLPTLFSFLWLRKKTAVLLQSAVMFQGNEKKDHFQVEISWKRVPKEKI